MQKVESSSLFSRLYEGPANRGVFVVLGAGWRRLSPRISSQQAAWEPTSLTSVGERAQSVGKIVQ
jgi:hypothetical protein